MARGGVTQDPYNPTTGLPRKSLLHTDRLTFCIRINGGGDVVLQAGGMATDESTGMENRF